MANAELQDLARRYAQGALSRQDYRSQRGQVLDALSSHISDEDDDTRRLRRPAGIRGSSGSPRGARLLLGSLGLLLAAILAWFLLRDDAAPARPAPRDTAPAVEQTTTRTTPATVTRPVTAPKQARTAPDKPRPAARPTEKKPSPAVAGISSAVKNRTKDIKSLAKALLGAPRWSARELDAFGARWQALDADRRAAARNTAWFLQLKYELFRRIGKQRARASLGDAGALDRAERLTRFASELGLDPAG